MMLNLTPNQLIELALDHTLAARDMAHKAARRAAGGQLPSLEDAKLLVAKLREAQCAAQEFENRVAGNPPPKRG